MFKLVVLSCAVAVATATGVWPLGVAGSWPLGLGHLGVAGVGGLGLAGVGHIGVPAVAAAPYGLGWGAPIGAYNYRGPLSLAPGQPANILAADGRPLDTLSVNLDRAAHITAQAVNGHVLKKRSAPILAGIHAPAVAVSHTSRIDLPSRLIAPVGYAAPLGLAGHGYLGGWGAPIGLAAPGHLGLAAPGHLGLGAWGLHGGLGHVW